MEDLRSYVDYMLQSAAEDWATAVYLYKGNRYGMCLFCCHLALEKQLKALFVLKVRDVPPYSHNLISLAEKAGISVNLVLRAELKIINRFNVSGRYKSEKLATQEEMNKEFTFNWFHKCEIIYKWLKDGLEKKLNTK